MMPTPAAKITYAQLPTAITKTVTVRNNTDNSEVRGTAIATNGNYVLLMNGRNQFYVPIAPAVPGYVFTSEV